MECNTTYNLSNSNKYSYKKYCLVFMIILDSQTEETVELVSDLWRNLNRCSCYPLWSDMWLHLFWPLFCPDFKLFRVYLKRRNFRGKKISRISRILAKFAEIISFSDPRKYRFSKINSREIFQNWWFAKINSREIFQELIKCIYWSFIQCDTVCFELGILETIGSFVICISKKVLICTKIVL